MFIPLSLILALVCFAIAGAIFFALRDLQTGPMMECVVSGLLAGMVMIFLFAVGVAALVYTFTPEPAAVGRH